jgi:hypothetical protein
METKPTESISLPTEEQLKESSPYSRSVPEKKGSKINGPKKGSASKDRKPSSNQIESENLLLRQRIQNQPRTVIKDETLALEYTGMVAGKTAQRYEEIFSHPDMPKLKALLTPALSAMNAAVKGKALDDTPLTKKVEGVEWRAIDEHGNPVYRPNALNRAKAAYQELFADEEFRTKLDELSRVIDRIQEDSVKPSDAKGISKTKVKASTARFEAVLDSAITWTQKSESKSKDSSPDF